MGLCPELWLRWLCGTMVLGPSSVCSLQVFRCSHELEHEHYEQLLDHGDHGDQDDEGDADDQIDQRCLCLLRMSCEQQLAV